MVVTRRRECPLCDCCLDATEPATHGLDEEGGCRIESKDSQSLLPVNVSLYSVDSVSSLALLQSASIPGRKSISGGGGSRRRVSHTSHSATRFSPSLSPGAPGSEKEERKSRLGRRLPNACGGSFSARRQIGVHGTEAGQDQEATEVDGLGASSQSHSQSQSQ